MTKQIKSQIRPASPLEVSNNSKFEEQEERGTEINILPSDAKE